MSDCTYRYAVDGTGRSCPRPAAAGRDECVFHLSPAERDDAGVSSSTLRETVLDDMDADDTARREYARERDSVVVGNQ